MNGKFRHLEMVRLKPGVEIPFKGWDLACEVGIVVGWTGPDENGRREVGIHWNKYGETVALCEDKLESVGRMATRDEIVTRSRAHQWKRGVIEEGK